MKKYYFYFKNDDLHIVYNVILKSEKAVERYVYKIFGTVKSLVIE